MAHSMVQGVTLYLNGRVWPGIHAGSGAAGNGDPAHGEALATFGGRVLAVGSSGDLRTRYPQARHVDLARHRVVPGLIDAHNHALRGGGTWARELHWTGLRSRTAALASLRHAAESTPDGTWITAIGGWHETQFEAGWLPSRHELDAVAPRHPVYVQSLYEVGIANSAAIRAVDLESAARRLPGLVALDNAGRPTGSVRGLPAFTLFLAAAGAPGLDEQVAGTRAMFRDFAALGLTGVCDPGGFGMPPEKYDAVYELWRRDQLDVRTRMYVSAADPGRELEQVEAWLRYGRRGFGDDWLSVTGVGEVVHFGCHDFEGLTDFTMTDTAQNELFLISSRVAARGWPMHIHAVLDESIGRILDCWERVHAQTPIDGLRFSFAHGDRIGPRNIERLRALNIGLVVDARQVFRGAASLSVWGAEAMRTVPPLGDLIDAGINLGVGSDATRASSHNPWLSLWWLVAGTPLDGCSHRDERHLLTREQALDLHTRGSAWFSGDEHQRGTLEPGRLADFVVLSDDYFTVEREEIPRLYSELTVAGERVSYSSGLLAEATDVL